MGCIHANPVNDRRRSQYIRKMKDWYKEFVIKNNTYWQKDSLVFIQREDSIEEMYRDFRITKIEMRDLRFGWSVRKIVSDETFEHYIAVYNSLPDGVL